MAGTVEKETVASSLNKMLEKSKKTLGITVSVIFVALVVVIAVSAVRTKEIEKSIELIDSVHYALLNGAEKLSENDVLNRQNEAIEKISVLSEKKGIAGVRANMLIADVKFAQEKFEESRNAWLKAADADKNSYTAPICYFNAAVCSENLNDIDAALSYYSLASDFTDFLLVDHALFSIGRVNEEKGNFEAAKNAYDKIYDLRPASSWALLGKSRVIAMKAAGNIQ